MATTARLTAGAPGVFHAPGEPIHALTGVRLDVCAFLGVAPRGPARVPVVNEKWRDDVPCVEPERPRRRSTPMLVTSFGEYRRLYGGFEGPGLLPYAVAAYFDQGGRSAYIVRIVHNYGDPAEDLGRTASGDVPGATTGAGPLRLTARNEGSWGNGLRASIRFQARPISFATAGAAGLTFARETAPPVGTLLRLTLPGGIRLFRFLTSIVDVPLSNDPDFVSQAAFDQAVVTAPIEAEAVEAGLSIHDGAGREERHTGLGLSPLHRKFIANTLCWESELVYPDASWIAADVLPDAVDLSVSGEAVFSGGEDAYADLTPEDFLDASWVPGNEEPGDGVHCLTGLSDLSTVAVPDLYSPGPLVSQDDVADPVSLAGPIFEPCVDLPPPPPQAEPPPGLDGLQLDPLIPSDLAAIALLHRRLVEFAGLLRSFIVLLDVPPGLNQRKILAWRTGFNSSYAAAYHPWIKVSRPDDLREALVRVPPSAFAAGVIAARELAFGIPTGPANVLLTNAVDVEDVVSPARHDALHPEGINVCLRERDGIRLSAARTLSRDPAYRQLTVRRLMIMLRRTLEQRMQWVVFEPNNGPLRSELKLRLQGFLRQLFIAGAFGGATESEAFFVRCDTSNNPPAITDAGKLVAEIGVAPSEPVEFIVIRLVREGGDLLAAEA